MDLLKEIKQEHSKAQCLKIEKYIGRNPKRFSDLVNLFLTGDYRVTQRAGWPLSNCVKGHPTLIKPHLNKLISNLKKPGQHDAVKRNTLRLLQFIDIPKSVQGKVVQICFDSLHDKGAPIAMHVFSMSLLANIAKQEPELVAELKIVIEDHLPYGSAGFRSRANKILKTLR